jgi:hypothetical protein
MANEMTMERLTALLDAYGASPARWPEEEREAAEAMIASSDTAREAFAEAARLDALLDQAEPPPPTDRLAWRLRGIGPRGEPQRVESAPRRSSFAVALARAAVIALAMIGGIGIGLALPEREAELDTDEIAEALPDDRTPPEEVLTLALFDADDDEDDGEPLSLPLQ